MFAAWFDQRLNFASVAAITTAVLLAPSTLEGYGSVIVRHVRGRTKVEDPCIKGTWLWYKTTLVFLPLNPCMDVL